MLHCRTFSAHKMALQVGDVAQWLGTTVILQQTFAALRQTYGWQVTTLWVNYGWANQANSAFHPFGVGKWEVIMYGILMDYGGGRRWKLFRRQTCGFVRLYGSTTDMSVGSTCQSVCAGLASAAYDAERRPGLWRQRRWMRYARMRRCISESYNLL